MTAWDNSVRNRRRAVFEGFALQMKEPGQEKRAREIAAGLLDPKWPIKPFGDEGSDFEITAERGALSVEDAWQMTYRLRAEPGVIYAEPIFAVSVATFPDERLPDERPHEPMRERSLLIDAPPLPESAPVDWSLNGMYIYEAWQRFFPDPARLPGQGIIVGHPDTGYAPHPKIIENLLIDMDKDFVDDDTSAYDSLEDGLLSFPGHGTSTASVIVSPRKPAPGYSHENIIGIAPGAKLIPLRVSNSVVHISMRNVANAIEYATAQGAHVISMSLGGPLFSFRLRKAITYAQKRGVIIVSAAGNYVHFVTWPAAYEEVIAVAASNARRLPWSGSSRGRLVDVTAPGESVWVARVKGNDYFSGQGSGTSFATAAVAGIAALWLSCHGRDRLVAQYGAEKIPFIFNQLLRETCDPVAWSNGEYGSGIVNAKRLLEAELPDGLSRALIPPAFALQDHVPVDNGGLVTFAHLFEQSLPKVPTGRAISDVAPPDASLQATLARLLQTTEKQLPEKLKEVGQELAFRLAVDKELYAEFEKTLKSYELAPLLPREGTRAMPPGDSVERLRKLLEKGTSRTLKNAVIRS